MTIKVCKFGGSSLADARMMQKVKAIVESDPSRRYVVPSAPGKRDAEDRKVTDLLYLCFEHARQRISFDEIFAMIEKRYQGIIDDLGLTLDLSWALRKVKEDIEGGASRDYAASRGEYLNGVILADYLGFEFCDAANLIYFDESDKLDHDRTVEAISGRLAGVDRAVVPGFYGRGANGEVKTFSRGGSDITGALIAEGVVADVYENWTDVSGLLVTDPRIVKDPKPIDTVSYRELRELAYMGATVLHDEAIFPVKSVGIPVNIRNTHRPEDAGTMIVSDDTPITHTGNITGIAGKKGFKIIKLEKALMNGELGFGRRVLSVLEGNAVRFEHMPSGIDTLSVVISDSELEGKHDKVLDELRVETEPDSLSVLEDIALIATVGRGMSHVPGMAAKLFEGLHRADVNIVMIDQGSGELNIIVGVRNADFEKAVQAIYDAYMG